MGESKEEGSFLWVYPREDAHSLGCALERMFVPLSMSKEDGLVVPLGVSKQDGNFFGRNVPREDVHPFGCASSRMFIPFNVSKEDAHSLEYSWDLAHYHAQTWLGMVSARPNTPSLGRTYVL